MKQSKLFGKTVKEAKSDMTLRSHKLLYQAGYIRESRAGRYYMLPLGLRVQDKICSIVEEEMNAAGAQKMFAPLLHPIELWQETNRDSAGGYELMTVQDRAGAKFALGGTAEEMFVDVVRGFQLSYKDLPINVYQFGYKFRDELRARGGLLRVREFVMKDAYSFHESMDCFEKEYQSMSDTYSRIFERVGLEAKVVPADNGYFGGDYCDEFVVESEIGESRYFESEDGSYIAHEDIASFKHVYMNPDEELLDLESVEQPEWVKSMEDNLKHYKLPLYRFLKNVVYKNRVSDELIIAVLRGDLDVNKNKLEKALDMVGLLEEAQDADLERLGVKYGYVRSWGHKDCIYVADLSLKFVNNLVGGQKQENLDTINVNYGRDFIHEIEADISVAQDGFLAPSGSSKLVSKKGVEVGNIFQLGQHYSLKMKNANFTTKDGKLQPYFMGCYGIGIGRTLATVVEVMSDEAGIIWPKAIAPYQVHLLSLDASGEVYDKAVELYEKLLELGFEVLLDDRDVRPGSKFADSDLIGIPLRITIGRKSLETGLYELKLRTDSGTVNLTYDELIAYLIEFYG